MKLWTKIIILVAIFAAVAYGSNAKDRNRWLAALGFSQVAATEMRIENARAKFHAARVEELSRWRSDARAEQASGATAGSVLTPQDVCTGLAQKQELLRNQGKEIEASLRRMQAVCSGDAGHIGD